MLVVATLAYSSRRHGPGLPENEEKKNTSNKGHAIFFSEILVFYWHCSYSVV